MPFPADLHEAIGRALARRGICELYTHQAESIRLCEEGQDVVVATPTASGKSLCYHLPVLNACASGADARALYLFPTKALARDQETSLRALMDEAGLEQGVVTYDGDTPPDARRSARERGGVVLSNPDMLHTAMLPHHTLWGRLISNLRYVVVDELHSYRGVYGSHLANVLRRLQRVCAFHGSSPVFVFASATIGNPQDHATRMLGRRVTLVDQNGAPSGARRVLFYNPPVVNREMGIRQNYLKAAVGLTTDLVRAGVSTLVFGQSRNGVEVMLKYLRDKLRHERIPLEAIHAYRGGYLPATRRDIERRLRDGDIRCVVATNALELGIDIGSLDAVVCAGYPGTLASLWQRFGRAGRRSGQSVALLVGSSAPLDQYFATHPDDLVNAGLEHARIDPDNVEILIQHIKCAAFEMPFSSGDRFGDVPWEQVREVLDYLRDHGLVHASQGDGAAGMYHWSSGAYPANHVSLRSAGWDNFVIVDVSTDRNMAEMDWRSAHTMLHEQAIYQHGGAQYQVERLDYENHKAFVRPVKPDYYTTAMTHTRVSVTEEEHGMRASLGSGDALAVGYGEVSVVEKVVGYKKIKYHTHENVGYGEVRLPEMQMHTPGLWFTFFDSWLQTFGVSRPVMLDALRGLAHAMHTVSSVGLMVDPRDLGRTVGDAERDPTFPAEGENTARVRSLDPTLFLYDNVAGGVGLCARLWESWERTLQEAHILVQRCPCAEGCPSCIGPDAVRGADGTHDMDVNTKGLLLELLVKLGLGT